MEKYIYDNYPTFSSEYPVFYDVININHFALQMCYIAKDDRIIILPSFCHFLN